MQHLLNGKPPAGFHSSMNPSISIQDILAGISSRLAGTSSTPRLDAQVLLACVLDRPRSWILAHPEFRLSAEQINRLHPMAESLERGVPLPYVIGHWEFFGLDFYITPDTLIPRPETELMVGTALEWLQNHPNRRAAADAGTGSGCIATALAVKTPGLQVLATDVSFPALQVARRNLLKHRVNERVHLLQTDLLQAVNGTFDLICANLPYIPANQLRTLEVYGKEPNLALDGGPAGLDLIARLLLQAKNRLGGGGLMLMEIEAEQGNQARALAQKSFPHHQVKIQRDLAGRDRLVTVQA